MTEGTQEDLKQAIEQRQAAIDATYDHKCWPPQIEYGERNPRPSVCGLCARSVHKVGRFWGHKEPYR